MLLTRVISSLGEVQLGLDEPHSCLHSGASSLWSVLGSAFRRSGKEGSRLSVKLLFYQHGVSSRLKLTWELWGVRKKGKREVNQQEETGQGTKGEGRQPGNQEINRVEKSRECREKGRKTERGMERENGASQKGEK